MAGSYPDVPSRRMAYDDDGTVVVARNAVTGTAMGQRSAVEVAKLNDESSTSDSFFLNTTSGGGRCVFIFPELREVDGIFAGWTYGMSTVKTSGDTTNGVDGSWGTDIANYSDPPSKASYLYYRDYIESMAASNKRAVEGGSAYTGSSDYINTVHLYGEIAAGQTPDRLLWIDNTTALEFTLPIDYGDIPRGSARDREAKLKNNSGSLTASTVQVTGEALYLASGSWYTFSEGGAFQATLALASSISSGASSPVITIRQIIPDAEVVGLHAARAQVSVGSWA